MAVIHKTTLIPAKLELVTRWLPAQPWYRDPGHGPRLTKVGGFRLDDPEGEVGIEFLVVTDGAGEGATTYQIPLTYRAGPCAGAGDGLIGTAEHGVLGHRWIYDGTCDPVLVAQLVALIRGDTRAQAQNRSDTPDTTVTSQPVPSGHGTMIEFAGAASGPHGTELRIGTSDADGTRTGNLVVRVNRILRADDVGAAARPAGYGYVAATWRLPDGAQVRGIFATAQHT
jgi:Maltokinase N-terminal cap domain